MLKANSKKTLDIIASQKHRNATDAYIETHPTASREVARAQASALLAKPEAQIYLQEHVDRAKATMVNLLNSDKEEIQYKSAQDILDRNLGRAIQQVQTTSMGVQLNIDLTSALPEPQTATEPIPNNNR